MSIIELRASAIPRIIACPASEFAFPSAPHVLSSGREAVIGQAVHDMGKQYVRHGDYDFLNSCSRHGLTSDESDRAAMLMGSLVGRWQELKSYFAAPTAESVLQANYTGSSVEFNLKGTLDVASPSVDMRTAYILDWKTGFIDTHWNHQMAAYAFLIWDFAGRPNDFTVTSIVCFLALHTFKVTRFKAGDLKEWAENLCKNTLSKPDTYIPCEFCPYCPHYVDCPASKKLTRRAIEDVLTPTAEKGANEAALSRMVDIMRKVRGPVADDEDTTVGQAATDIMFISKLLHKAADDATDALKQACAHGPIKLPTGDYVGIKTYHKKSLDPVKTMNVVRRKLSDSQLARCSRYSLPAILDHIKASVSNRQEKKRAEKHMLDLLEGEKALTYEPYQRLIVADKELFDEQHANETNGAGGQHSGAEPVSDERGNDAEMA